MTFSIIIPVFQVEKYLVQCLESVLNQNFEDYEVILIDDGSTDNSGKICDDYASKYSNIEVIHQTNSGISVARNNGMVRANGDYIVFIDSDDYIEPDSFKQIYLELTKSHFPDLLITLFKTFISSGETFHHDLFLQKYEISAMHKEEIINLLFTKSDTVWGPWRYIVKREFIKSCQLKFPAGMLFEDSIWTPSIFLSAATFSGLNYYWYNYRIDNPDSITRNIGFQEVMDILKIHTLNIQLIHKKCNNITILKTLTQRSSKEFLTILLLKYHLQSKKDQGKIMRFFKENQKVFKQNNSFKYLFFFNFADLFGLGLSLKIYRKLIELKERLSVKKYKEKKQRRIMEKEYPEKKIK